VNEHEKSKKHVKRRIEPDPCPLGSPKRITHPFVPRIHPKKNYYNCFAKSNPIMCCLLEAESIIKFTLDSDETTKYFHALPSSLYRKIKIAILEINRSEIISHDHKMKILTNYYKQLLGQIFEPTGNFSLPLL
jgi:hypothetical protein